MIISSDDPFDITRRGGRPGGPIKEPKKGTAKPPKKDGKSHGGGGN